MTFTLTLTNNGPDPATGVRLAELLPAGFSFVSATASQGSYAPGVGVLTVGTLGLATPATLSVTATVMSPGTLTNTASINAADQFDPDTANNSATVTVSAQQADLALTKTVSNPTPNVGDPVTFTVTVTNAGPDPATAVQITDVLPAGLSFMSATPSQGTYTAATGLWDVGTITVATPATLTLATTVASAAAQTNTASIGDADQFDANSANNTASATVTPQQADLALTKTVSAATRTVGDQVTFTLTVTNAGPASATGVRVSDVLPAGLSFVSATASQGTYTAATGVWNVGTVTTATPATLTLTATVVSAGAIANTASITAADQFDPTSVNSSASAAVTAQQPSVTLPPTGASSTNTSLMALWVVLTGLLLTAAAARSRRRRMQQI